jgi:hypothetical protein
MGGFTLVEVQAVIFRIYHETQGGHVHLRVFSGIRDGALGKCGNLCMRVEEFAAFKEAANFIQFLREDRKTQVQMR